MKLIEYLQRHSTTMPMGGGENQDLRTGTDESARDDLLLVQATNNGLFKAYFIVLIVIMVATIGIAILFRQEMGGLATVLGAGGIVQGGLVLKLATVWMDKARIDIIAVLARKLPPDKLQPILLELSKQIRK